MVFAFLPAWWSVIGSRLGDGFFAEWNGLGHGGEGDTSITMAVRPDLCDLGKAMRQMPVDSIRIGERVQIMWDIAEVSATGATGVTRLGPARKRAARCWTRWSGWLPTVSGSSMKRGGATTCASKGRAQPASGGSRRELHDAYA